MSDKDITRNLIAALLSCFIPGLGQALVQQRFTVGAVFFIACFLLWFVWLGWIIHVWAVLDAAFQDPKDEE